MKPESQQASASLEPRSFASLVLIFLLSFLVACAGESEDLLTGQGENSGNVNFRGFGGSDATSSAADLGRVSPGAIGNDVSASTAGDAESEPPQDSTNAQDTQASELEPTQDTKNSDPQDS